MKSEADPSDDLTLRVLVPASAQRPIVLYDPPKAHRLAVVEHDGAATLDNSWNSSGVYMLLWPPVDDADRRPKVYVGQAAQGLRRRILQHVEARPGWHRAVLVDRANATFTFDAAEVGWLERRLWRLTSQAEHVQPMSKVQPNDGNLHDFDRASLEPVVAAIRAVMRLLGYSIDPPRIPPRGRTTIRDLIAAGELKPGDVLDFTDQRFPVTATVTSDGRLELHGRPDLDGRSYPSVSAAAAKVRQRSTNGWGDWALRTANGTILLNEFRQQLGAPSPSKDDDPGPA